MSNLIINEARLWDSLMQTATIGAGPNGGIARLTLSIHDKDVRDWLTSQCESLGMSVRVDEVGNIFAYRAGQNTDALPIAMGSHLDTQPTGGKFDGILGVLGALEVIRTLHDAGYTTDAPLMLVNWTNEEGSRFSPAMLGSGVYAGVYDIDYAYGREDVEGQSFGDALEAIGYKGSIKAGAIPLSSMFELHIEQGPILEAEDKTIGVVQGVQAMRWYEVKLTGRAAHTGSTPMTMRCNALVGAARAIEGIDKVGHHYAPDAVATVGFLDVKPNSNNVIPGEVHFTIDMRHPDDAILDQMEQDVKKCIEKVAAEIGLKIEFKCISKTAAVVFDQDCINAVRFAADKAGLNTRDIVSGAGHDAAHIAHKVPTTMIFVPSEGGLSHNEAEATASHQCAAGVQVLLDAVLEYDRRHTDSSKSI